MLCCGPRTGQTRSAGLSFLRFMAIAHSNTAATRCLTLLARTRVREPDAAENRQHVGARDLRDRLVPDARERIAAEAVPPVPRLLGVAPAGPLLLDDGGRAVGQGGHALPSPQCTRRATALRATPPGLALPALGRAAAAGRAASHRLGRAGAQANGRTPGRGRASDRRADSDLPGEPLDLDCAISASWRPGSIHPRTDVRPRQSDLDGCHGCRVHECNVRIGRL